VSASSRYDSIINAGFDAFTLIFTSSKLHERLRRLAELRFDVGIERSTVDADANRHATILRLHRHDLHVIGLADVARIEPQAVHSGIEGSEGELVLEMDVGDDRNRRTGNDLRQPLSRFDFVARAANDVAPVGRKRVDLRQGGLNIGRLGGGHRLHADAGVTANGHLADVDLAGDATRVGPKHVSHHVGAQPSCAPAPPSRAELRRT
jgi:hypothetical protein